MPDIIFKCEACRNHLVVDEARRGMSVECPDCHASITIPSVLVVHQCPHCQQRLMLPPAMKGELVHCSSCQGEIRLPGQSSDRSVRESPVVVVCPECHAEVEVPKDISGQSAPCPRCGKQVRFQGGPGLDGVEKGGPPIPKGHDWFRFKQRSR
jgi:uncharacterized paraquat-inducible protein A